MRLSDRTLSARWGYPVTARLAPYPKDGSLAHVDQEIRQEPLADRSSAARPRLARRVHLGRARPAARGADLAHRGHLRHPGRRHERAVLADGWAKGGAAGARVALDVYWDVYWSRVGEAALSNPLLCTLLVRAAERLAKLGQPAARIALRPSEERSDWESSEKCQFADPHSASPLSCCY